MRPLARPKGGGQATNMIHGLKPPDPRLKYSTKTLTVVKKPLYFVIDSMSDQILCVFNQIMSLASRQLRSYKPAAGVAQAASAGSISRVLVEIVL